VYVGIIQYDGEFNGPTRAKAAHVRNQRVLVCSLPGDHLFYAWPQHGAASLFSGRPGTPERLDRTIAAAEVRKATAGAVTFTHTFRMLLMAFAATVGCAAMRRYDVAPAVVRMYWRAVSMVG
jgi:hypothetical protein